VRVVTPILLALLTASLHAQQPPSEQPAPPPAPTPISQDAGPYKITSIVPLFEEDVPGAPSMDDLLSVRVKLAQSPTGWSGRAGTGDPHILTLSQIPSLAEQRFYGSAVRQVCRQLVAYLQSKGFTNIIVAPPEDEIDYDTLRDVRPANQTVLHLWIKVAKKQ
jgi:hypothetical protein